MIILDKNKAYGTYDDHSILPLKIALIVHFIELD